MAEDALAAVGRLGTGEKAQQRALAGAVLADEADAVAALQDQIKMLEDVLVAVALADGAQLEHAASDGLGLGKGEVNRLFLGRHLDLGHALELLDAALHLRGLGGGVAEAVDEDLELLAPLLLVLVGGADLGQAVVLLAQEAGVVSGVERDLGLGHVGDAVHHGIEEVAIVGDEQAGVGILAQVF